MAMTPAFPTDHLAPPEALATAPPLVDVPAARLRTPAEEARALVAATTTGTLATLSDDASPWASFVAYAALDDGAPVFLVSTLAEHGRNLHQRTEASLVVSAQAPGEDPLDAGRVTLAGRCERPEGERREAAQAAFLEAVPMSRHYAGFGDFDLWVLGVERVRWVGGYGRMDSTTAEEYASAEVDPVVRNAPGATDHLNRDHADALLLMARRLGGFPDATEAVCKRCDRYGLDLWVSTPRGGAPCRVPFELPVTESDGLRQAAVALVRRAREQEDVHA